MKTSKESVETRETPPLEAILEAGVVALPPRRGQGKRTRAETQESRRERQRRVCADLLKRWVPLATAEELALRKENRGKPVIDEEPLEAGLKAGAFVLKVLERLAKLDGLDAAEKREVTLTETADPLELARRVQAVSPVLAGRLSGGSLSRTAQG